MAIHHRPSIRHLARLLLLLVIPPLAAQPPETLPEPTRPPDFAAGLFRGPQLPDSALSRITRGGIDELLRDSSFSEPVFVPNIRVGERLATPDLPDSLAVLEVFDPDYHFVVRADGALRRHWHASHRYRALLPAGRHWMQLGYVDNPAIPAELELPGGQRTVLDVQRVELLPDGRIYEIDPLEIDIEYAMPVFGLISGLTPDRGHRLSDPGFNPVHDVDEWPAIARERALFGQVVVRFDVLPGQLPQNVALAYSDYPGIPAYADSALAQISRQYWWLAEDDYSHAPYRVWRHVHYWSDVLPEAERKTALRRYPRLMAVAEPWPEALPDRSRDWRRGHTVVVSDLPELGWRRTSDGYPLPPVSEDVVPIQRFPSSRRQTVTLGAPGLGELDLEPGVEAVRVLRSDDPRFLEAEPTVIAEGHFKPERRLPPGPAWEGWRPPGNNQLAAPWWYLQPLYVPARENETAVRGFPRIRTDEIIRLDMRSRIATRTPGAVALARVRFATDTTGWEGLQLPMNVSGVELLNESDLSNEEAAMAREAVRELPWVLRAFNDSAVPEWNRKLAAEAPEWEVDYLIPLPAAAD